MEVLRTLFLLSLTQPVLPFGRLHDPEEFSEDGGGRRVEEDQRLASCFDNDKSCRRWAGEDECKKNPPFMLSECRASCYVCQSTKCHDVREECAGWAEAGQCASNMDFILKECTYSCKVCNINFKAVFDPTHSESRSCVYPTETVCLQECRRDPAMKPAAVVGTVDETFEEALVRFPQECPHTHPKALCKSTWRFLHELRVLPVPVRSPDTEPGALGCLLRLFPFARGGGPRGRERRPQL